MAKSARNGVAVAEPEAIDWLAFCHAHGRRIAEVDPAAAAEILGLCGISLTPRTLDMQTELQRFVPFDPAIVGRLAGEMRAGWRAPRMDNFDERGRLLERVVRLRGRKIIENGELLAAVIEAGATVPLMFIIN